jgi:hypothetical protein
LAHVASLHFPHTVGAGQHGRRGSTESRQPAGGVEENRRAAEEKLEQFLDVLLHDLYDAGHLFWYIFVHAGFSEATVDIVVKI